MHSFELQHERVIDRSGEGALFIVEQNSDHAAAAPSPPSEQIFAVGGLTLALRHAGHRETRVAAGMSRFELQAGFPNIHLTVRWIDQLGSAACKPAFDSGALWTMHRDGGELLFDFSSPVLGAAPYRRMQVSSDFRRVQIALNRQLFGNNATIDPLEYPTDELLVTNYLAHHGLGIEVHGCGLIDASGGAHLFLGHSGAGKSTTARLWHSLRGAEILSDDRIILRLHDGELWMYGTPWHGEGQFASPNKAKVERIFILQHGAGNSFIRMTKARAVGELFVRSFPPFHSAELLGRTVEILDSVAAAAPCYEFHFTPDASAIEAVLRFHD